MKILIVDDNQRLTERVFEKLKKTYTIETAQNGHEAIVAYTSRHFDLVILDLGLPDMSGAKVCKHIRSGQKDTPILILTAEDSSTKKTELLKLGADDYIVKPFDENELKARIEALLRRIPRMPASKILTADDLSMNIANRKVSRGGVQIKLRRKEFDILECLLLHKGEALRRETIIHHAWNTGASHWNGSVDVHIKHLRDKIDKPFQHPLIKTVYAVGYTIEDSQAK